MENLLGLYFGGLIFSFALSVALWRQNRSQLNLDLCWVWLAGTFSAVFQGGFPEGAFAISFGFSSTILTNLALSNLLARLSDLKLPWKHYLAVYVLGVSASALIDQAGGPFWAVALPIALTVPIPTVHTGVRALRKPDLDLGTTGRAFIYTSFAFVAHNLDFPFLRNREDMAPIGFAVAIFLVWALAPTGMAVVLERIAEERGRIAELEALKSRFFANVSHELRTPLTLILGPIQKLITEDLPQNQRRSLEIVHRNAQRLLRLIDDLLDLSRMEAGSLQLTISNVDMSDLVRRVCELAAPAAAAKNIELAYPRDTDPVIVFGDPHRLEIIVTNLVSNAIKYTPDGGHARAHLEADDAEVQVVVSDDGPGIAEEDKERVFDRFVRVGRNGPSGVGIGLALSRELAELHEGQLTVDSALGAGATFTLRLPRRGSQSGAADGSAHGRDAFAALSSFEREQESSVVPSPTERTEREASDSGVPIRLEGGRVPQVLIVEDEEDLRRFVADVVGEQFSCLTAQDGVEAWEMLRTERPDLILTDVMMPHMTGTELCQRVKADRGLRTTPVVLLTARSGADAALEGYSSGADDFVAKPFHPRVLMARIRSHLTVRQLGLQLADQARLATAGSLAAGVAHEVRNPINAVLNAIEALERAGSTVPSEQLLEVVFDGVRRIHSVVDALDSHVRPAERGAAIPLDVREGVDTALKLLQHRAAHLDIQVQMPEGVEVMAPARAFNQVLLNLLDNGLRAAASTLRVVVTLPGDNVRLCVDDDGPGVPPDLRGRIFDPFFTTRDVGEGAGLGLFLSRKLARDVGGDLRYETRPEGGARFVLELPRLVTEKSRSRALAS